MARIPILIVLLLASLFRDGRSAIYYHPVSDFINSNSADYDKFPPNTLRIEALCALEGYDEFIGSRLAAGYFGWRDWINSRGGICLSENGGANGCTDSNSQDYRLNTSIKVIDWADGENKQTRKEHLQKHIIELCKRPADQRPHFVIAPFSMEYGKEVNDAMKTIGGGNGCNIPTFFHVDEASFFSKDVLFQFNTYPLMDGGIQSSIEFFSSRNNAKTYAILGTTEGAGRYLAEAFLKQVRHPGNATDRPLSPVMLRCMGQEHDPSAPSCKSSQDCGGAECTFARHNGDPDFASKYVELLRSWMSAIILEDPDVVVFTEIEGVPVLTEMAKERRWAPRAVLVMSSSGLKYYPLFPTIHWVYSIPFSRFFDGGLKDTYMGTTAQFVQYISPRIKTYITDPLPSASIPSELDVEFIGIGAVVGITIQRAVEYAYQGVKDQRWDPNDPFSSIAFHKMVDSLESFGECGYNREPDGTISVTGVSCSTDSDCGAGVSCYMWENFFGTVHFDKLGVNKGGSNLILQVYNVSDNGTLSSRIIAPSSIDQCNLRGDCAKSRGWECQCTSVYPALFEWLPKNQVLPFHVGSNDFSVVIITLIIFTVIYVFGVIVVQSKTKNVVISELPPVLYTIPLFAILSLPTIFFYTFAASPVICACRSIFFFYSGCLIILGLIQATRILNIRSDNLFVLYEKENKLFFFLSILILVLLVVVAVIFPQKPMKVVYDTGVHLEVIEICSVSYFQFIEATLSCVLAYAAIYYALHLLSKKRDHLTFTTFIMAIICTIIIDVGGWVFEIMESHSVAFISFFGLFKTYALLLTCSPVFIYIIRESLARKKTNMELNNDIKFIESLAARPVSRAYFHEFLKDFHLDFYTHVSVFRQYPAGSDKQEYEDFIFDTYLGFGPLSIGAPPNIMDDIQKKMHKGDNNIFDKSQKACLNALQISGKVREYLHHFYSEYAHRLQVLLVSLKNRDVHVKEVLKDLSVDILKRKNRRARREAHKAKAEM